jgi:hypothetical protein
VRLQAAQVSAVMRPLVESIEYRPNFLFRVPESVPVSLA